MISYVTNCRFATCGFVGKLYYLIVKRNWRDLLLNLYSLIDQFSDTKYVVPKDVVSSTLLKQEKQLNKLMKSRWWNRSKAVSDPVTKNGILFYRGKLHSARNNVALFSCLFISCQTRKRDFELFFSHENQAYSPTLSEHGKLWPAKGKSSIFGCILLGYFINPNEGPKCQRKNMWRCSNN